MGICLASNVWGSFDFKTAPAKYIHNIPAETWKIVARSHAFLDTILAADKEVRGHFTADNIYKKDSTGKTVCFTTHLFILMNMRHSSMLHCME